MLDKYYLLLLFSVVALLYFPTNWRKSKYYFKWKLDTKIPLVPIFVLPYISFFPYIALSLFILWNVSGTIELMLLTMLLAKSTGTLFWVLVPNGVARPKLKNPKSSIFTRILQNIYSHDNDTNGFPSSHIFLTFIVSAFLISHFSHIFIAQALVFFIYLSICLSTLLTKQHYISDVIGGLFWGLASLVTVMFFF